MLLDTLIFVLITANAILGFLIFVQNRKNPENRFFALFVIALDAWIIANFLENEPALIGQGDVDVFLRLDFALAILTAYSWLRFCVAFTGDSHRAWVRWTMGAAAAAIMVLCFYGDLIVGNIGFEAGLIHFETGPLWPAYALFLVWCCARGVWRLLIRRREVRVTDDKYARRSIDIILYTFFLSIGNAIVVNLVLQTFFPISRTIANLGIYGMVFLVVGTAYAVARRQFLNVRMIVVDELAALLVFLFGTYIINRDYSYTILIDGIIFGLVVIAAISIARSVRREVRQRELLENVTAELQKANDKLGDLSKFKSQLLSIASHQIKAPLSIIKGYLTLILEGAYGPIPPDPRDVLLKTKRSADGLTTLIEDLLNLRKAEEGHMNYRFTKVDLSALASGIAREFAPLAMRKGLEFGYPKDVAPVLVNADAAKLREILKNLIDNSIKYTEKGFVQVNVIPDGRYARFSVADSGLGMSPELIPRLFGEFVRDERVERKIQGTGFGLYVAKKIVDAHGGTIKAESPGEGKGSTFSVVLPRSG